VHHQTSVDSACLTVDGLRHSYDTRAVLADVSFGARKGEIVCLLGRSGCGKTTLLRLIAGLEHPDSGRIALNGRELTGPITFVAPEQRGIGLVFQDYALFPHLTVLENATFGITADGQRVTANTASMMLERVGLGAFGERYPHLLSAGEQQRAALVRALATRPWILLMDEPFSNLDVATRESVRETTMALIRDTGGTAIVVTHDPSEAMQIADRIVLMQDGRIVQNGTPSEIYRRPTSLYAARYFSDLAELNGDCSNGLVMTALGAFRAPVRDGPVVVGIRPQAVRLTENGTGPYFQIVGHTFMGPVTSVKLHTPALDNTLTTHVHGDAPVVGQQVRVTLQEDQLLFFPTT